MSSSRNLFKINGMLDTRNSIWDNIEKISSAASAWTTYDTTTGKWSLVINREETPLRTFDDSNIIGDITLTKTALSKAYTKGKFKYANRDIPGAFDSIEYQFDEINTGNFVDYDYRSTDIENKLEITNELVNEYVQADVLLNRELKQSRRRTNIEFYTDFGALDLKAGDVINVKNDLFYDDQTAVNNTRKFRVIEIEETDGDGGEILLKIIGVEYSDEDYELFGFERFNRETADPMPPFKANTVVQDDIEVGNYKNIVEPQYTEGTAANDYVKENTRITPELNVRGFTLAGPSTVKEGEQITYTITAPSDCCTDNTYTAQYSLTGISASDVNVPLTGRITITNGSGSLTLTPSADNVTEGNESMVFTVGCKSITTTITDQFPAPGDRVYTLTTSAGTVDECDTLVYTLTVTGLADGTNVPYVITGIDSADLASGSLTGNFSANWSTGASDTVTLTFTKGGSEGTETIAMNVDSGKATANTSLTDAASYVVTFGSSSIVEGATNTVTITVDGIPDGTAVPWALSGAGTSRVTSATSGTVTLSGGAGSFTISTNDNSTYEGTETVIVTAGPVSGYTTCGTSTGQFSITDNESPPPGDVTTIFTSVPVVWRGTYDGTSGELKSLSVAKYANVQTFPPNGTAVAIPTAVTVTQGNPSTIAIDTTITAYTGTNFAGTPEEVITTFDSINPNASITGTTSSVATWNT